MTFFFNLTIWQRFKVKLSLDQHEKDQLQILSVWRVEGITFLGVIIIVMTRGLRCLRPFAQGKCLTERTYMIFRAALFLRHDYSSNRKGTYSQGA